MATPNRIMTGNAPQEVQMARLSKSLQDQLGVRLEHSDLKKLGYRAEKRPNNPNTYYKVPGLHANIENCPKVVRYIRQVFLQNKKQELEKLLGKGATPKLPPSSSRRAAAPDAAPEDQDDDADDDEQEEEEADEEQESSDDEDQEMEEVHDEAAEDGDGQSAPPGYVSVTGEKQDKVLDGMASYISSQTHLKGTSGADLAARGMRVVEESRPLAPGERMRHAFVWWPARMDEPLRCAQYIFAAKNLLDMPKAREALGLPPLAPAKASGGSASVPAKKRPSSASDSLLTPPASIGAAAAAKRTRTSTGEAPAPATAPPAGAAANTIKLRSSKASQAAAAAGGSSAGGAGLGAAGARASHFPASPSPSGGAAAAAAAGGGKTRGSNKAAAAAAAAAAGGSGAAAGGKSGVAVKHDAGDLRVLDSVDDAVKLLGEALELARSLPPSVLNSLPCVFTAGLDSTLQEFLSSAVAMHEGLSVDKVALVSMAAAYAAEMTADGSGGAAAGSRSRSSAAMAAAAEPLYRRPYLAFRAALGSCASDAHAWLQDKQQREMIARLEGLCQIKQQLEDKQSQEAQMRREQEAMRQQKEKLEQELKAYKERLQLMEQEHRSKSAAAAAGVASEGAAAAAQQQQASAVDAARAAGADQAA